MVAVRRVVLLLVAALALTACRVDIVIDVAVQADGSGTITVVAVADAGVVVQAPGLADDLRFDDAVAAGWEVVGPTADADGSLNVRMTHSFATVEEATALLASLSGPAGPLQRIALTRTVDGKTADVQLTGSLRVDGGLTAFTDSDLLQQVGGVPYADQIAAAGISPADAVGVQFSLSAPGTITSATGTVSNDTATWIVPLDGTPVDVATTASLTGGGEPSGLWKVVSLVALALLVVWVVFATGFIAFVARERKRRAARRAQRMRAKSAETL